MTKDYVIEMRDITKRFGEFVANDQINLNVKKGEIHALLGENGAGKSTLVNLLLRFDDVASGRILIDGQNIAEVTQDSLRAQVGMVTQDTSLLHRSVRDNLCYGRPDASEAEMMAAARRAEAHDFILGLSDPTGRHGYDAHVGERGVKLSGGQRQRIAIARVMLKNAPILVLVFTLWLRWLPGGGWGGPIFWIMPVIALSTSFMASIARIALEIPSVCSPLAGGRARVHRSRTVCSSAWMSSGLVR